MADRTFQAAQSDSASAELMHAAAVLERHFAVPFHYFDLNSQARRLVGVPEPGSPEQLDWLLDVARNSDCFNQVSVRPISDSLQALVIPLKSTSRDRLLAVGVFAARPLAGAKDAEQVISRLGEDVLLDQIPFCQPEFLQRVGEAASASMVERSQLRTYETELKQLASQLTRNYEEITLLHQVTRASQVSQGVRELQELTLSLLDELLPARQLAYIDAKNDTVLSRGETLLYVGDCHQLISRLGNQAAESVVVDNQMSQRGVEPNYAEVKRLICVPVAEGKELFGWLLALGTKDGSELGSVEASLMTAVSAILATHQTNVKLFGNIKDLFLGVVRALSSAIDAKDPYTCGHSERVARLARRLARELGLGDDDCNRIYLSGILHDVGKIGVRDAVLLKPGRLTPEELAHIQEHPKIGFDILSGVRQLRLVLAGVRSHHEHVDGSGYPDRLAGEGIPLMARILAVADAYDAMTSDRPYRKGMDREQVERIFRDGAGRQWDCGVVNALLSLQEESQRRKLQHPASCPSPDATLQPDPSSNPLDIARIAQLIPLST